MASLSVLLLDRHPTFRYYATRFVQEHLRADLVMLAAVDIDERGLALTAALQPQILLLGLGVPADADLALIPTLRAALPLSCIIVLGIFDQAGYEQAARAAGADSFLVKTALAAGLLPTIRRSVSPDLQARAAIPGVPAGI